MIFLWFSDDIVHRKVGISQKDFVLKYRLQYFLPMRCARPLRWAVDMEGRSYWERDWIRISVQCADAGGKMRVLSGEIESFAAVFAGGNASQIYWERFDENFEAAPVCALARLAIGRHQKMEERGLSQLHCAPSAFFLMYEGVFYLIVFLKRENSHHLHFVLWVGGILSW